MNENEIREWVVEQAEQINTTHPANVYLILLAAYSRGYQAGRASMGQRVYESMATIPLYRMTAHD